MSGWKCQIALKWHRLLKQDDPPPFQTQDNINHSSCVYLTSVLCAVRRLGCVKTMHQLLSVQCWYMYLLYIRGPMFGGIGIFAGHVWSVIYQMVQFFHILRLYRGSHEIAGVVTHLFPNFIGVIMDVITYTCHILQLSKYESTVKPLL